MTVPRATDRILFIHVSRIGDTLFATPAMRAVAAALPEAHLTVLGHPGRVAVLHHLPFIQRCGAMTRRRAPWLGRLSGPVHDWALVYGFDGPLVDYALRVAHRVVAFRQREEALNRRLFRVVDVPPFQGEHAVLQMLRLPAALAIAPSGLRLAMALTGAEVAAARLRLALQATATPLVGLQVASFPTKAYRDWPVEHFLQLCQGMISLWPAVHFVILGGGAEQARTQWLQQQLGSRATSHAGRLTLRETAALMSQLDLYVGVDTGPTHMMSTFDIPMVALYHCLSSSALTGPIDHPCCYSIDHPRTGQGCTAGASMAEITVDRVLATAIQALETRGRVR
ncbi:MAG: glycosyltransferase family 9 protein [Magnetococcus sp. DMHC-8]